ncbi:MAG TPA: ATP-dependent DNA ligase [Candidatus Acidoferrum sp.]|nr:ATP-dependent DNA ligase [Candidatus Acidoferrum sp.]
MALEIKPPLAPMDALSVEEIPEGSGWQYEPKWDGFRCLVFRNGGDVQLQSKAGQPLARYFPEVVAAVSAVKAKQFSIDGELVIPVGNALSFDDLLQRIHPAASRVKKLSEQTPATLIVFDLLADSRGKSLLEKPLRDRRIRLEEFTAKLLYNEERFRLSPTTTSLVQARKWLGTGGASLDGVIAKQLDASYESGERSGVVQKIKLIRTADCVVGGFRYAEKKRVVGSLLLGLYDDDGKLNHVGFCSGFKAEEREALTKKVEKLIAPPGFTGRAPGGPSRWSTKRSAEWQPLAPKLVVEVGFDHVSGDRFRHGTRFIRWRPDKAPQQCTMDQMLQKKSRALELLLAA